MPSRPFSFGSLGKYPTMRPMEPSFPHSFQNSVISSMPLAFSGFVTCRRLQTT